MSQTIAVIVAHPDDEVLGCGATIAKHHAQGDHIVLLVLGDGESSRAIASDDSKTQRQSALSQSAQLLGIKLVETASFPDNAFDSVPLLQITQRIEQFLAKTKPARIYTHSSKDLNIDHQRTAQAVLTAARPQPHSSVRCILAMEVVSATEWNFNSTNGFSPNVFQDVSDFVSAKFSALACYEAEMRPAPHSRSLANIQNQLGFRGHCVGMQAAEAFELVYCLEPAFISD